MNFNQWFRRTCLKYFLSWLWLPFCSAERNHLCNFGREEQFCEIILNLDQWFRRRCHLKDLNISYLELWQPSCSVEWNHLCSLKEGIMGNIHAKLYEIWTSGLGGDVV